MPEPLHLLENLKSKVGLTGLDVSPDGGIKQGFGESGKSAIVAKKGRVKGVVVIRGNEGEKKGLGVGELVVAEETREESEEREGSTGDSRGGVGLKPLEEGEEGGGTRCERSGGEDREEEGQIVQVGNVGVELLEWGFIGSEDSSDSMT